MCFVDCSLTSSRSSISLLIGCRTCSPVLGTSLLYNSRWSASRDGKVGMFMPMQKSQCGQVRNLVAAIDFCLPFDVFRHRGVSSSVRSIARTLLYNERLTPYWMQPHIIGLIPKKRDWCTQSRLIMSAGIALQQMHTCDQIVDLCILNALSKEAPSRDSAINNKARPVSWYRSRTSSEIPSSKSIRAISTDSALLSRRRQSSYLHLRCSGEMSLRWQAELPLSFLPHGKSHAR